MKSKNILIGFAIILLTTLLLYGLIRVILGRQRRVNVDASLKYANILSQDIQKVCDLVEVEDDKAFYSDYANVDCYFSAEKSNYNKARIAVDSNGVIDNITYMYKVDVHKQTQINIDRLNANIYKLSTALFSSQLKLKYGDFVNLSSIPDSLAAALNDMDYNKTYKIVENGNENAIYTLKYGKKINAGVYYIEYQIN